MNGSDFTNLVGPALAGALQRKGFTSLTPVQESVLAPELAGRDLRITSQTGSGKTVAIGLSLRELAIGDFATDKGVARPRALVVAPTRELAKQVEEELSWLYAPLKARVVCVTGGASYRDERRALNDGPAVVVGTPGRLLDHLQRKSFDPSNLAAIVLDEADRMLDLGFRDDLLAILGFAPEEHLTHLCSATFPREVRALADKVQRDPAHVEGTPLGTANADIDHVIHLVEPRQRVDAIVNLLLGTHDAQTLVFARTRAEVARITRELSEAGFDVSSLSGEMDQPERNRALAGFKRGDLHALIATDVAARGIDVQDIARVIHAEPPDDADAYTHRSGRTGRAGRKGTSSVLVSPSGLSRTRSLLSRAGIRPRIEPIPTADVIRAARDERIFAELTDDSKDAALDPRAIALADRLVEAGDAAAVIARLLTRSRHGTATEPREVRAVEPPVEHRLRGRERNDSPRPSRTYDASASSGESDAGGRGFGPRGAKGARDDNRAGWVPFRVSWGREQGADARRLLAVLCRRGGIRGSDVGAIQIARSYSVIEVASAVAQAFERAAQEPDPRDPRVTIRPEAAGPETGAARPSLHPSAPPSIHANNAPERRPAHRGADAPPHAQAPPQAPQSSDAPPRAHADRQPGAHTTRAARAPAAAHSAPASAEPERARPVRRDVVLNRPTRGGTAPPKRPRTR